MSPEHEPDGGLQSSLDHIERLAAELKEIAQVMGSDEPTIPLAARDVTTDLSAEARIALRMPPDPPLLAGWLDASTAELPESLPEAPALAPAGGPRALTAGTADSGASDSGASGSRATGGSGVGGGSGAARSGGSAEAVRHGDLELVFGPGMVRARHVGPPPASLASLVAPAPAPHAVPPAASPEPAASPAPALTARSAAQPRPSGRGPKGPEPLFTEADVEAALAFAESDVAAADAAYFEAEEAFAAAERQKRIDEGRRAEAAERAQAAAERDRRAGSGRPPGSGRAQRSETSSKAAAAVASGAAAGRPGVARPGGVPAAGDGSGPRTPRRSAGAGASRRPVPKRSDAPARRRAMLILGAAALAVPAFALGATQPWKSVQTDPDRLGVVGSDRGDRAATESEAPASAVRTRGGGTGKNARNPHPAPSIGIAPGPAVAGVLSAPGGSVLPRISPLPSVAPSAHRNDGSVPGLNLTVQVDDVRPHTGTAVHFTLAYTDGTGYYAGTRADWGDGSPKSDSVAAKPCTGDAPAASGSVPASHTFTRAGTYTVVLSATTYTCDGRTETQTVPMTITVSDSGPDPVPSGAPSPVPTAIAPSP